MKHQHDTSPGRSLPFRISQAFAPLAALAGVLSFVAVAVFGVGKADGTWMFDFYWYYAGGLCFGKAGMYDVNCVGPIMERLTGLRVLSGLNYPPHFTLISIGTSILPLATSARLFMWINILLSLGLLTVVVRTEHALRSTEADDRSLSVLWAVLIVLGSSGMWASVWLGQMSVLLALCMWVGFRQIQLGNDVAAGSLLAIASIKPQMAFLLFLWILLHGRFKVLAVAGVVAGLLSAVAFAKMGIVPVIAGWLQGLASYQDYPVNKLGNSTIMGLPSFLALYGVELNLHIAMGLSALAVIFLRFYSKVPPFAPISIGALLTIQMLTFSRQYDTVLIAPVFALFWPRERSHPNHYVLFMLAVAVFCFPQQLVVRAFPVGEAAHFRTSLLLVLAVILVRQMLVGSTQFVSQLGDQRYRECKVDGGRVSPP